MCIAFPGRVLAIEDAGAVLEVDGRRRRASTLLHPEVRIGDWVLVGAGTILRRLEAAEAADLTRTLTLARASTDAPSAASNPGGPR